MRITYAKLVGYAGFYVGLGKKEVTIDFTKCRNRIVVISGANGCGKSTLLSALSILPDSNECFLPTMEGLKKLQIIDQDVIFDILIVHGLDSKGNRSVTKAYIAKNGVELNPNGNISSYKDIIFNEFNLDSNFITLTHVSGTDRGLADKRPSDRKKFIASITSSLEVYNDINKKLTKKSNIYRSYINNISTKIQNIGNDASLRSSIISLDARATKLNTEIENIKQQIVECKTVLSMNDPDGKLQEKYELIEKELANVTTDRNNAFSFMRSYRERNISEFEFETEKDIETASNELRTNIDKNNSIYHELKEQMIGINSQIQNITNNIDQYTIKIAKLNSEIDTQLDEKLESTKKEMFLIEDMFGYLGLGSKKELEEMNADDIKQVIMIIGDFLKSVDLIYENIPYDNLPKFIDTISSGIPISIQLAELSDKINKNKDQLLVEKEEQSKLLSDYESFEEFNKRPSQCQINDCYFLSKFQDVTKKYRDISELESLIYDISSIINNLEIEIVKDQEKAVLIKDWIRSEAIIDKVRAMISTNMIVLSKLCVCSQLTNFDFILQNISNGNLFNDFRELLTHLTNMSNDLIQYKSLKKIYDTLEMESKLNQNNKKSLEELQLQLSNATKETESLKIERDKIKGQLEFTYNIIDNLQQKESKLKELKSRYESFKILDDRMNVLSQEINKINNQFKGSAEILSKLSVLEEQLKTLIQELEPVTDQKKILDSQILLLDAYQRDYAAYHDRHIIIEKLKKYSSPTSAGIQTLFMSLYMGKTLEIANQLLGMLFQGQYQLLNYIINENEFRIPFASNGFTIDDISSGSTSQICMMGMIINLVLLHQASTKFNIARLDEIDGGLDTANRSVFVDILQKIIQVLGIEQLFIISHSCESTLINVDAIQLAPIEGFDINNGANVIYSWKD